MLVVVQHDRDQRFERLALLQQPGAHRDVQLDLLEFLRGQAGGFGQQLGLDAQLAQVVHQAGLVNDLDLIFIQVQLARDGHRVAGDLAGMSQHVGIAQIDHLGQRVQQAAVQPFDFAEMLFERLVLFL